MGVNKPKKMRPRMIGLTINPSRKPNRIHNLLNGRSSSSLKTVTNAVRSPSTKKNKEELSDPRLKKQYALRVAKIPVKNEPNLRFEGSSIFLKLIFLSICLSVRA